MMSRLRPEEAYVHVMGCDLLSNKQGNQVVGVNFKHVFGVCMLLIYLYFAYIEIII